MLIILSVILSQPNWEDTPSQYEYSATINAIVFNSSGEQLGDCIQINSNGKCLDENQDILAAFDAEGNVRGVATMLFPPFGPYANSSVFEIQIRGNDEGDILNFKYYDITENYIHIIDETYEFIIDDVVGDVATPLYFNITPDEFEYENSTQQAFYFFTLAAINGVQLDSTDWVGAFNGNVCVGARKWNTLLCNSGICDVPVMGYDNNLPNETAGYMMDGDIPSFKIYDFSNNEYYDAQASEDIPWGNNEFNMLELLNVEIDISACTDPGACNYDPNAMSDDGSCIYAQECTDCEGESTEDECGICDGDNYDCESFDSNCICSGCTDNAACNYNENAIINNGSCYFESDNYDCDGNCVSGVDCLGICGGTAIVDQCNVCQGDNSSCSDCAGIPNGLNLNDNCGVCDSDTTNDCVKDCSGAWGGVLIDDECGVCGGDSSTCTDCNNIINGEAYIDGCGECVGGNTGNIECSIDCAGIENGSNSIDNCGVCDSDTTNDCVKDCSGVWGGTLIDDECGICGGDNSSCVDCAGIPNGLNTSDNCGICDSDSTNDCVKDCDGVWGGVAALDLCDVCNGNCFGGSGQECYETDCDGNCVATGFGLDENGLDCFGVCDGIYTPTFPCEGNWVCSPTDCSVDLNLSLFAIPDQYGINKIYPNPFNPITTINFVLIENAYVKIRVFDIQGRLVADLLNDYRYMGEYSINWDAFNHSSGVYMVEMLINSVNTNSKYRDMRKILYLK